MHAEPVEYVIAIPTSGRWQSANQVNPSEKALEGVYRPFILEKTLGLLGRHNIPVKKVHLFVADSEEMQKYKVALKKSAWENVNIVVGTKGIMAQRNRIVRHFPDSQFVLSIDDDVAEILWKYRPGLKADTVKALPDGALQNLIYDAYWRMKKNKAYICGLSTSANPRNMKIDGVSCKNGLINGYLYFFLNRRSKELLPTAVDATEDAERSLRYFAKDGIVLRYRMYAGQTRCYKNGGGLQALYGQRGETKLNAANASRKNHEREGAMKLHQKFPDLTDPPQEGRQAQTMMVKFKAKGARPIKTSGEAQADQAQLAVAAEPLPEPMRRRLHLKKKMSQATKDAEDAAQKAAEEEARKAAEERARKVQESLERLLLQEQPVKPQRQAEEQAIKATWQDMAAIRRERLKSRANRVESEHLEEHLRQAVEANRVEGEHLECIRQALEQQAQGAAAAPELRPEDALCMAEHERLGREADDQEKCSAAAAAVRIAAEAPQDTEQARHSLLALLEQQDANPEALQHELQEAQRLGVAAAVTSRAEQTLLRIKAADALRAALASGEEDLGSLEASIRQAEQAGVPEAGVEGARARLGGLRRERACAEAAEALTAAEAVGDADALAAALAEARTAGVARAALSRAEERLAQLRREAEVAAATEALSRAAGGVDIAVLAMAIERAQAVGVGDPLVRTASGKLRALRDAAERRAASEASLRQAVDEGGPDELAAAVAAAELLGVEEAALGAARARLEELREARERERTEAQEALAAAAAKRAQAEIALNAALARSQVHELQDAIDVANAARVDYDLLEQAADRIEEIRKQEREEDEKVEMERRAKKEAEHEEWYQMAVKEERRLKAAMDKKDFAKGEVIVIDEEEEEEEEETPALGLQCTAAEYFSLLKSAGINEDEHPSEVARSCLPAGNVDLDLASDEEEDGDEPAGKRRRVR